MKKLIPSSFLRTFANSREQSLNTKSHKRASRVRFFVLMILAVFFTSSMAQVLTPAVSYAATLNSKTLLGDQVLAYATYNAMVDCLGQEQQQSETNGFLVGINLRTNEAHMKSGDWWRTEGNAYWGTTQGAESAGSYLNDKVKASSGGVLCNDMVKAAPALFGYSSVFDFACSFIKYRANNSSCKDGNGDFGGLAISRDEFKRAIPAKAWPNGLPIPALDADNFDAADYLLYREAFMLGCSPKESASPAKDFAYKDIRIIADDGSETKKTYEGVNRSDTRQVYRSSFDTTETKNCGEIANRINELANKFKQYKIEHPNDKEQSSVTDTPEACTDTDTTNDAGCEDASSCGIEGIGWILCPVITFSASIADAMFGFLATNFLETDITFLQTSGSNSGTFIAWGIIRNVSNIAFVLVFLIIIFSQLTGLGIANYGIKKMLPRLVIGAILVNVSFFACQLAVDLSNVLGYSVKNVFDIISAQVTSGAGGSIADDFASGNIDIWGGVAIGLLAAGTVGGVLATASLGAFIAALLAAIVAVAAIFFILIIRQVLVVLLIVIAPLAFVAFLLPNTEKLFDQWRKAFVALLLVFPVIGLVYGASSLASSILKVVYSGTDNTLGQVVAAATLMVPLIAVPFILKKSLDGVGNLGNIINGFSSKVGQSAKGSSTGIQNAYKNSNYGKFRANRKADIQARTAAGNYAGLNPLRRVASRTNRGINANRAFNAATGGFGASQDLSAQAQDRKDMAEAMAMFNNDDALITAWSTSGGSTSSAEFAALDEPQKQQFRRMRDAGHHRKSMSFLAGAQYLSENGKGSAAQVTSALSNATKMGASKTIVSGALEGAIAGYRKSGRGDALAALSGAAGRPMTPEQGWAEVAASAVHRDGLKTPQQMSDFTDYLRFGAHDAAGNVIRDGQTATLEALRGFDKMETRAQNVALAPILQAASQHAGGMVFADIQQAKAHFGIV